MAEAQATLCGPASSDDDWFAPGVNDGASLTAVTLTLTESLSLCGPPVPVLPPSFVVMLMAAEPLKFANGVYDRPFSAPLMLEIEPENVMAASEEPSPALNVRPAVPLSESRPFEADSETCTVLPPASGSETEIAPAP